MDDTLNPVLCASVYLILRTHDSHNFQTRTRDASCFLTRTRDPRFSSEIDVPDNHTLHEIKITLTQVFICVLCLYPHFCVREVTF